MLKKIKEYISDLGNESSEIPNKEQKDKEINILQKEQERFKSELVNLNNGYEKIIDDASIQIEEFINKNNFS